MTVRKRILTFILTALFAVTALKILLVGYDIDEQYAVSMAYRLLKGDRLLADLWEPHQTSGWLCMLLMAPYAAIFHTTTGIVLYLRLWGLLLHSAVGLCLYRTLKSYLDREHALLVCGIYFFALPKIMFLPEFSNIQIWCLLLAVLCLLRYYGPSASQPGSYALRHLVFAGCFLALEVLSYPSTLLAFAACVGCMIRYRRRSPHSLLRELACLAAPCLLGAVAFLAMLLSYIPLGQLGTLVSIVASDGSHSAPWGERLLGHGQSLGQLLLFFLGYSLAAFLLQLLYRLKAKKPFSPLLWCPQLRELLAEKNTGRLRLMPRAILALWVCVLMFGRCYMQRTTGGRHETILDDISLLRQGPALGLVADTPSVLRYRDNYRLITNLLPEGAKVFYMGSDTDLYLMKDLEYATPSTICSPTFDHKVLSWFSLHPDRVPDYVVCDAGLLYSDPWVIGYVGETCQESPVGINDYLVIYQTRQE